MEGDRKLSLRDELRALPSSLTAANTVEEKGDHATSAAATPGPRSNLRISCVHVTHIGNEEHEVRWRPRKCADDARASSTLLAAALNARLSHSTRVKLLKDVLLLVSNSSSVMASKFSQFLLQ